MMLKLYKQIKRYWVSILIVLVSTFIQIIMNLQLPNYTADIINNGIIKQDISYIWQHGVKMLGVAALSMGATIIVSYFASRISMGFGRDLRVHLFSKVENLSLQDMSDLSTASLITRTTNDVQQIQNVTTMILRMALSAPITAIGSIIMAITKQRQLSLIFAVVIPLLLLVTGLIGKFAVPLFSQAQKKLDQVNLIMREKLTGIRVIRAYNKEPYESKKFRSANKDLMQVTLKVNNIVAILMPIIIVMMNVMTIAIIWFGAQFVDQGVMQPGDIIAFIQYAMQTLTAFIMLAVIFIFIPRAAASAERINEVLDRTATIKDPRQPRQLGKEQALVFDRVSFRYPGAEEAVLTDISFTAKMGETIAIIGGTGSGKSTLMNLIPRFYEVSNGTITLNGVDISELSQADLRQQIGYIPQKNILFSGTIADNIRFGKKDASIAEMTQAAKIAQAYDFIMEKEAGFDSIVEQGGTNFSGGQKQRLAITRAIVRHPEIYLFDDSFSALDFKTDAALRQALHAETEEAIVIIVGQRISTIQHAQQIIVLDEGKIDAIGTHQELLQTSQIYQQIAYSQLSEEELA